MELWQQCILRLKGELTAAEFNTWILPLQARTDGESLRLFAPNKFVQDWARQHYETRLLELARHASNGAVNHIRFEVGGIERAAEHDAEAVNNTADMLRPAHGAGESSPVLILSLPSRPLLRESPISSLVRLPCKSDSGLGLLIIHYLFMAGSGSGRPT